MEEEKFIIKAEWYDEISSLVRPFTLFYYPSDRSIEMVGLKLFQLVDMCFKI